MPLNINSVGSSGVGGSDENTNCMLYTSSIKEAPSGGSNGSFKFLDDFICADSLSYNNDKLRNYMYYSSRLWNTPNNNYAPVGSMYINHDLYVLIGFHASNTYFDNCTSSTVYYVNTRPLYKFTKGTANTDNSTFTQITTFPSLQYVMRNPSLSDENYWLCIGSSRGIGSSSGGTTELYFYYSNNKVSDANIWKFNGTTWTVIASLYDIWIASMNGGTKNSSIAYGSLYNAYKLKNHLYLIMNSPVTKPANAYQIVPICVDYNLDTASIVKTYEWEGSYDTTWYNNMSCIISNTMYDSYISSINDDTAFPGQWTVPFIRKWKTDFPNSNTLTNISNDYISSTACKTIGTFWFYQSIVSRIADNHYIIGIASQSSQNSSSSVIITQNGWIIHKNTLELYIDPTTGEIVENRPFKTAQCGDYQFISYPYFSDYSADPSLLRSCISFDYNSSTSMLSFSLNACGNNNETVVQYSIPNFKNIELLGGGGNVLTGYFDIGDTVYCSGTIINIDGDFSVSNINKKIYKIKSSGNVSIHASSDDIIPSFIVISSSGSVVYAAYSYNSNKLQINTISGMKCNDVLISVNKRDYILTDSRFGDRLYLDMKGVQA